MCAAGAAHLVVQRVHVLVQKLANVNPRVPSVHHLQAKRKDDFSISPTGRPSRDLAHPMDDVKMKVAPVHDEQQLEQRPPRVLPARQQERFSLEKNAHSCFFLFFFFIL